MRGFPPTYLNGPPAPNPHLAATYMANLNKAAAYAAAAQAQVAAGNTIPRHYSYQVKIVFKILAQLCNRVLSPESLGP